MLLWDTMSTATMTVTIVQPTLHSGWSRGVSRAIVVVGRRFLCCRLPPDTVDAKTRQDTPWLRFPTLRRRLPVDAPCVCVSLDGISSRIKMNAPRAPRTPTAMEKHAHLVRCSLRRPCTRREKQTACVCPDSIFPRPHGRVSCVKKK